MSEEGEIDSSSGSSTSHDHIDDVDDESPPAAKKKRTNLIDYSEPGLYEMSGSSSLSKKDRKKQRKKEVKALVQEFKQQKQEILDSQPDPLTLQQVGILRGLIDLSQGRKSHFVPTKLKTASFQPIVSHIVCGYPASTDNILGDEELSQHRVVVLWMAMISDELFTNSEQYFPKFKSLQPCIKFKIEHPGSARFVKSGLESFLCVPEDDKFPKPEIPPIDPKPPRNFYALTKDELVNHGFPVPGTTNPIDTSDYVAIISWPTKESQTMLNKMKNVKMFAIDCEMVEIESQTSALARLSIVDESLNCIYDTLVKPDKPVTDYRTKFSGIDENMLKNVTVTLNEVQRKLMEILPPESILVGHSLDNDLHALQLIHPFVIDTSCIFTPNATPMCKPGLRRLAKDLLQMDIQAGTGSSGHNSIEDASTCMKLVQLKITSGQSCTIKFNQSTLSVITEFRTRGKNTGIVDRRGVVSFFGRGASFFHTVETDAECVDKAIELIPQSDFTFLQFHEMEFFHKNAKSVASEQSVVDGMDNNLLRLVEGCPKGTLLFVVCGSGDIRNVQKLQRDGSANPSELKKAVMIARTGLVTAIIIS